MVCSGMRYLYGHSNGKLVRTSYSLDVAMLQPLQLIEMESLGERGYTLHP